MCRKKLVISPRHLLFVSSCLTFWEYLTAVSNMPPFCETCINLCTFFLYKLFSLSLSLTCVCVCAVLAIVLVGLLYGFFIAIICGQRISERHYHVLAKQELTKVYFLIFWTNWKLVKTPLVKLAGRVLYLDHFIVSESIKSQ